ncbi:M10 family metallopeptidase C-terminal domain-containing protein [Pseudaestuariivita atlantica]|uniref:Peptidase metallopeptidase domain-containing protein n=1 Tax=Pseudaestuariivita atlantica TaxID=1317121 RepID=A0A0L1JMD6_9RHOB|nr:M10 family metallopeptidase C-terminal domain-containing protein [Pseudaestuariivita atlantica]KNG92915.1 hypothetical protein ATO11_15800 [Pseudaestuariivita atlantica]
MLSNDLLSLVGDAPHYRWNIAAPVGTPVVITYSFPTEPADYDFSSTSTTFAAFSSAHQVHIRTALDTWAAASGITFVEVPPGEGDIRFSMFDMTGLNNSAGRQLSGYAYYPSIWWFTDSNGNPTEYNVNHDTIGGDVFLNSNYYFASAASIAPGQRGYSILLHEIGHAIGLEHPFEGTYTIDPARNNGTYTVMAYDRPRSTTELGIYDLEAMEYLYGPDSASLTASYDAVLDAVLIDAPDIPSWLLAAWDGANVLTGGAGDDTLLGARGNDTLMGGPGDDSVRANEGDDLIYDGPGADTLEGGYGNDTVMVMADAAGIEIVASSWSGTITRPGGDTDLLASVETIMVTGSEGIYASAGGVDIHGGGGDDTMVASLDGAMLDGGDGNDILSTLRFVDATLIGGAGNDTIDGNSEDDVIDGGAGDDVINGGDGNDMIEAGSGADAVDGGGGYDIATFFSATRSVRVDLQNPAISFGDAAGDSYTGVEEFRTGDGIDQLRGDAGDNIFRTGGVSDRLYGRAGDDLLFGEAGADAFYGGLGADTMTAGDDAGRRDRFIYFNAVESGVGAGNRDVITDFVPGEDRIELSRIDADLTQGFKQAFQFIGDNAFSGTGGELRFEQQGGITLVQADRDGDGLADFEIELTGTHTLTAGDFLI